MVLGYHNFPDHYHVTTYWQIQRVLAASIMVSRVIDLLFFLYWSILPVLISFKLPKNWGENEKKKKQMQLSTTDGHTFFEQSSMNFKDRRNSFSSNLTEDTVLNLKTQRWKNSCHYLKMSSPLSSKGAPELAWCLLICWQQFAENLVLAWP